MNARNLLLLLLCLPHFAFSQQEPKVELLLADQWPARSSLSVTRKMTFGHYVIDEYCRRQEPTTVMTPRIFDIVLRKNQTYYLRFQVKGIPSRYPWLAVFTNLEDAEKSVAPDQILPPSEEQLMVITPQETGRYYITVGFDVAATELPRHINLSGKIVLFENAD